MMMMADAFPVPSWLARVYARFVDGRMVEVFTDCHSCLDTAATLAMLGARFVVVDSRRHGYWTHRAEESR